MSCIFNICENVPRDKLGYYSSMIGGILFFTGWWLMIDVHATYATVISTNKVYYLPGMFATAAFIVVNIIPMGVIQESYYYSDRKCCGPLMAKASLFIGLLIAFGSLIASSYILVNDFLLQSDVYLWPGFGIFLQNLLIFSANMLLKFGTKSSEF
ncbi:hypothetical protein ILUMI_10050 [Ignelater luminosus]|uniref:Transmembrane protein 50A n=1 Tax=Ignelater luminosus TaxID=2038154 RepID=A0A8K0D4N2_IGNLU|nr:hypothetical protein ILUMI_10050 [Ignelater luminosus]